jgi:ectoine hydroxylase-related dioxygenase (phytanoyl-CoA dioxygenase family)
VIFRSQHELPSSGAVELPSAPTVAAASSGQRRFSYQLGHERVSVTVEGQTLRGDERVLLHSDDNLAHGLPWEHAGFTVAPFVSDTSYRQLVADVTNRLLASIRAAGVELAGPLDLTHYHRHVRDDALHLRVLRDARAGFLLADFPIALAEVTDRVGALLGRSVTAENVGFALDRWHIRVVRPHSNDHNPLHRDVWLDRLRNAINLYVPLAGSDETSSLPLAPGSHRWPESVLVRTAQGASVDGVSYTVPAVVGCDRPLHLERPNPRANEILLFSPYLVHGGGRNTSADRTRVSLEMRFWRKP